MTQAERTNADRRQPECTCFAPFGMAAHVAADAAACGSLRGRCGCRQHAAMKRKATRISENAARMQLDLRNPTRMQHGWCQYTARMQQECKQNTARTKPDFSESSVRGLARLERKSECSRNPTITQSECSWNSGKKPYSSKTAARMCEERV